LVKVLNLHLVNHYAVNIQDKETANIIKMKVDGINSISSYAKVLAYLRDLSVTNLVEVIAVTNNEVTFSLSVNGTTDVVEKTIKLDRFLEAVNVDPELQELHYRVCL
jgi:hypothetical protein